MSRAMIVRLSLATLAGIAIWPAIAMAQFPSNPQQSLRWQSARAPYVPGAGAVAGGPGNSPDPNSPMFICRTQVQGSVTPGKWVKGNCNVAYGGREISAGNYQVAYGRAVWRQFSNRNQSDLIQTGNEANGTPLYSCRARYRDGGRDVGFQPGKIVASGKCDIAYGGREVSVNWPFEALYAGNMGTPAVAGGGYPGGAMVPGQDLSYGMPLCKPSDPDVHLWKGVWSDPNCVPIDARTREPVYGSQPRPAVTHVEQLTAPPPPPNQQRELCRKGDPGVSLTAVGYAGPNCITSNAYGEVAAYGNATKEERERLQPCEPGADGVHVENGMLVGADCKSVPAPKAPATSTNADNCTQSTFGIRTGNQVTGGNSCVKNDDKQAAERAAAEQRAAGEAAELKQAKEDEANAAADARHAQQAAANEAAAKAAQQKAEEQAAADKAAADQRAAAEADELKQAKEAEAKAEQEKADQVKAAAEQKAAEDKAAEESRQAQEAAAKEAEAKAAKDKDDAEKAAALQKAFADQAAAQKAADDKAAEPPPPSEDKPKDEPESSSDPA